MRIKTTIKKQYTPITTKKVYSNRLEVEFYQKKEIAKEDIQSLIATADSETAARLQDYIDYIADLTVDVTAIIATIATTDIEDVQTEIDVYNNARAAVVAGILNSNDYDILTNIIDTAVEFAQIEQADYRAKYGAMTDAEITRLGMNTGYNCMKSKYQMRGIETYCPWNPKNKHDLHDFEQNATLGIIEYLNDNNLRGEVLTDEELTEARRAGYRACNAYANAMRQDAKPDRLYIEQLKEDKDGNTLVTEIVDVTAAIGIDETIEKNWLLRQLWGLYNVDEKRIIKYHAKGWTDERIAKKFKFIDKKTGEVKTLERKAIMRRRHDVENRAKEYCHDNNIDVRVMYAVLRKVRYDARKKSR